MIGHRYTRLEAHPELPHVYRYVCECGATSGYLGHRAADFAGMAHERSEHPWSGRMESTAERRARPQVVIVKAAAK